MQIQRLSLLEGAKNARGITVVVDVYRAFVTILDIFKANPREVLAVGSIEKAKSFKKEDSENTILIGEDKGIIIEGFDYCNSPSEIQGEDFTGKRVIFRTSNGVQGLIEAHNHSDEVIPGSFANASAIAKYIQSKNPKMVSLVAMGALNKKEKRDEDELCTEYLKDLIENKKTDFELIRSQLLKYKSTQKFLDSSKPEFPREDAIFCLTKDTSSFIVKPFLLEVGVIKLEKYELSSS